MANAEEDEVPADKIVFEDVKKVCCDVMKNPSVQNLENLLVKLKPHDSSAFSPEITNYVVFPLVVHMKGFSKLKSSQRALLFRCMEDILRKSDIHNDQIFMEVFQNINFILGLKGDERSMQFNVDLGEDIVSDMETSLVFILMRMNKVRCDLLFGEKFFASVGHCIYMQLQVVKSDLCLGVRLKALEIIEVLFSHCQGQEELSRKIFSFFPGIVSALVKSASTRVGRVRKTLVIKSLQLLSLAVITSLTYEFNEETLEKVDRNLEGVVRNLSEELITHEVEDVFRSEMAKFSIDVLEAAGSKIPRTAEVLNKNVLIASWDPTSKAIRDTCQQFLQQKLAAHNPTDSSTVETSINLLRKAYNDLIFNKEADSISSIKIVASTLLQHLHCPLLFTDLSVLFPPLAKLFTYGIVSCSFKFGVTDISELLFFPQKTNKNEFIRVSQELCKVVNQVSNMGDILEEIVPFVNFNSSLKFEERLDNNFVGVIFLLSNLLKHYEQAEEEEMRLISSCDLESLVLLYIGLLDKNWEERGDKDVTPRKESVMDLECILLLEGLSACARLDEKYILPLVLYYFCEFAGCEVKLIAEAAKSLIRILAQSSTKTSSIIPTSNSTETSTKAGTAKIDDTASKTSRLELQNKSEENSLEKNSREDKLAREFLTRNLDLIMSELSVRTRSISSHPNCPNALLFLANVYDFSQPVFVSFIEHVFTQSCDQFYTLTQVPFSKIFYAFIWNLWLQRKDVLLEEKLLRKDDFSLMNRLLQYQNAIGVIITPLEVPPEDETSEEAELRDSSSNKEQTEEEDGYDQKLGPELKLVLNICQRVLNFIAGGNDRQVQLVSMDCLIYGIQLLEKTQNALLPLAHTIWQNLLSRFTENDLTVVRKSFELLLTACKCSGSFLKKRVVQQVFPKLNSTLISLASSSERFSQRNTLYYTHTQAYKLQHAILGGLADLCLSIELQEEELDMVVSSCLVYLKPWQHKNLREAAVKLINVFAESDQAHVIWMKLCAHGLRKLPPPEEVPENFTPLPEFGVR